MHVESVAWIAERKDVLYGLFWLASLLAYFRHRLGAGWCGYWASLMLFVLALMSKPSAVTLPGVLVLLELTPGLPGARGYQAEARPVLRAMAAACPRLLPFFVLSLICAGVTLTAQTRIGAAPSLSTLPLTDRADNAWMAYEWYLGKCFVPVNLCASYVRTTPPELWRVLSAMSLFLALTLWSWRLRRRVWLIAFGWLWFVITLLPTIGLLQAGPQSTADRYAYLPCSGSL